MYKQRNVPCVICHQYLSKDQKNARVSSFSCLNQVAL
jgi:hypothetical protein